MKMIVIVLLFCAVDISEAATIDPGGNVVPRLGPISESPMNHTTGPLVDFKLKGALKGDSWTLAGRAPWDLYAAMLFLQMKVSKNVEIVRLERVTE